MFSNDVQDAQESDRVELETMELDSPEMIPSTLGEIQMETRMDPTLSALCEIVAMGWQLDRSQVPSRLHHFYGLRDELTLYNGVLYKGQKVVIPASMQSQILKKLHQGHQGGESMVR